MKPMIRLRMMTPGQGQKSQDQHATENDGGNTDFTLQVHHTGTASLCRQAGRLPDPSWPPKAPEDRRSPKPCGPPLAPVLQRGFRLRLSSGALVAWPNQTICGSHRFGLALASSLEV